MSRALYRWLAKAVSSTCLQYKGPVLQGCNFGDPGRAMAYGTCGVLPEGSWVALPEFRVGYDSLFQIYPDHFCITVNL